jgi:O-antigen ligase
MQPSLAILAAVFLLVATFPFIVLKRPTFALTLYVIGSISLDGYSYAVGSPVFYVRVGHILLVGVLIGFAIAWAPIAQSGTFELRMCVFLLWAILSGYIGGTMFRADAMRNVGVLINGFAIPVILLYLARSTLQPASALRSSCSALTALCLYLVFTAFCEHFQINRLVFPQYILDPSIGLHADRARGPVVNAAENGGIIALLLVVALHRVRYAATQAVRLLGPLTLLLAGLPALWFTQTRGPWVAFAAGLLIMILHDRRRGVISAFLIIAAIVIPVALALRVKLVPQRSETEEFRLSLYRESLDAFSAHPIVGWGLGTFSSSYFLFDSYGPSSALAGNVEHDTTVAIATENGAIGAILYISFIFVLFRTMLRQRKSAIDLERKDFYTMCIAALTVFVVNGMFADCRFWMPQNALVFLLVGLGLATDWESVALSPVLNRLRTA